MMTKQQSRALSMLRLGKPLNQLSTYQWRSIGPLVEAGYIRLITCGHCVGCKHSGCCYHLNYEVLA